MSVFNFNLWRPTEKQNCLVWTLDGEKVTAYYHQLKEGFVGLYDDWKEKTVAYPNKWEYAILPKRHSQDLFPNMIDCMGLKDGLEVFRTDYSCLKDDQQERLFREVEIIQATITHYFKKKYEVVTCCKCGKVETDYETSQAIWKSTGYDKNTATVLCECPECYKNGEQK